MIVMPNFANVFLKESGGQLSSELAVFEMVSKLSIAHSDVIKLRKVEALTQNNKKYSNQLIAKICTYMGLEARPVNIRSSDIRKITPISD